MIKPIYSLILGVFLFVSCQSDSVSNTDSPQSILSDVSIEEIEEIHNEGSDEITLEVIYWIQMLFLLKKMVYPNKKWMRYLLNLLVLLQDLGIGRFM